MRGSHSPQIIAKYETCILDDVLAGWVDPDRGKEPGGASQDRAQGPGDPQEVHGGAGGNRCPGYVVKDADRWEAEILFKELKSKYVLDVVPTANQQVIEAFIWIAVLTLLISRRIYTIIRGLNPDAKMVRFTHLRWSTIFSEKSGYQLMAILRFPGIEHTFDTSLKVYSFIQVRPSTRMSTENDSRRIGGLNR